jgi:hypothetical protein
MTCWLKRKMKIGSEDISGIYIKIRRSHTGSIARVGCNEFPVAIRKIRHALLGDTSSAAHNSRSYARELKEIQVAVW